MAIQSTQSQRALGPENGLPVPGLRINRDLGNIAGGALQTMPSSENEPRNLLEEDYDEEMNNNLGNL